MEIPKRPGYVRRELTQMFDSNMQMAKHTIKGGRIFQNMCDLNKLINLPGMTPARVATLIKDYALLPEVNAKYTNETFRVAAFAIRALGLSGFSSQEIKEVFRLAAESCDRELYLNNIIQFILKNHKNENDKYKYYISLSLSQEPEKNIFEKGEVPIGEDRIFSPGQMVRIFRAYKQHLGIKGIPVGYLRELNNDYLTSEEIVVLIEKSFAKNRFDVLAALDNFKLDKSIARDVLAD